MQLDSHEKEIKLFSYVHFQPLEKLGLGIVNGLFPQNGRILVQFSSGDRLYCYPHDVKVVEQ